MILKLSRVFNVSNINIQPESGVLAAIGVGLSPLLTFLYGDGNDKVIILLFLVIAMDWITGVVAANKDQVYTSEYGIEGVLRSIVILLIPSAAKFVDDIFNTPNSIFYGTTFALIYHIGKSVTANAIRANWDKWIPSIVIENLLSEVKAKSTRAKQRKEEIENGKASKD